LCLLPELKLKSLILSFSHLGYPVLENPSREHCGIIAVSASHIESSIQYSCP
jgi:hypothetical protein